MRLAQVLLEYSWIPNKKYFVIVCLIRRDRKFPRCLSRCCLKSAFKLHLNKVTKQTKNHRMRHCGHSTSSLPLFIINYKYIFWIILNKKNLDIEICLFTFIRPAWRQREWNPKTEGRAISLLYVMKTPQASSVASQLVLLSNELSRHLYKFCI